MSKFKVTLNAEPRDPVGASDYGFEAAAIDLVSPDGDPAVDIVLTSPDPKDRIVESVSGADTRQHREKRAVLDLDIDWVDDAAKQAIELLYWNGRDVRVNANYDRTTILSYPLTRDFVPTCNRYGLSDVTFVRGQTRYVWDERERVYRKWVSGDPAFAFHRGAYYRGLVTEPDMDNRAAVPHPSSSGTGWSFTTGTGSISHRGDVPSPVLAKRGTDGIASLRANAPGTTTTPVATHTASSLSGSADIGASICIRGQGNVIVRIEDSAGNATVGGGIVALNLSNDDEWQQVKLYSENASGGTTASLRIFFADAVSNAKNVAQIVEVGPVGIYSVGTSWPPSICDWVESSTTGAADQAFATGTIANPGKLTVSFITRWAANDLGFFELGYGSSERLFCRKFADDDASLPGYLRLDWASASGADSTTRDPSFAGLSEGDVAHIVWTLDPNDGSRLYINGIADPVDPGPFPVSLSTFGSTHFFGSYNLSTFLANSCLQMFRLDSCRWSSADVQAHFETYAQPWAVQSLQRFMGRVFTIDDMQWTLRQVFDGQHQWIGKLSLVELDVDDGAPVQQQEGL